MSRNAFVITFICAYVITLSFGFLNYSHLVEWARLSKAGLVVAGLAATWLAATIEFVILMNNRESLTGEQQWAAVAKAFAAFAITAGVLAAAEDFAK